MSEKESLWQLVCRMLRLFFEPIVGAAEDGPDGIKKLFAIATESGVDAAIVDASRIFAYEIASIVSSDIPKVRSRQDLLTATGEIISAWRALTGQLPEDVLDKLVEYLALRCLWNAGPVAHSLLALLGVLACIIHQCEVSS